MNDSVFIEDSNGSDRRLKLFLSPSDGDIYVSVVEPGDRLGLKSVRICTSEGNPNQGEIHWGLKESFDAALNRGCGEEEKIAQLEEAKVTKATEVESYQEYLWKLIRAYSNNQMPLAEHPDQCPVCGRDVLYERFTEHPHGTFKCDNCEWECPAAPCEKQF